MQQSIIDRYQADASQSYKFTIPISQKKKMPIRCEKMSTEDAAALFSKVQGNYTETKSIDHFLKGKISL